MHQEVAGWHKALQKTEPFVEDPRLKAQVRAMIELLDAFVVTNC